MKEFLISALIFFTIITFFNLMRWFLGQEINNEDDQEAYANGAFLGFFGVILISILLFVHTTEQYFMNKNNITKYGMIDKQRRYVGVDMSTNGKPPFPVDSPYKAKWWDKKEDRDNYIKDYYQLAPIKSTLRIEKE